MSGAGRHRRRTSRNASLALGVLPTLGAVVGFSAATAPTPTPAASAPVEPESGSAADPLAAPVRAADTTPDAATSPDSLTTPDAATSHDSLTTPDRATAPDPATTPSTSPRHAAGSGPAPARPRGTADPARTGVAPVPARTSGTPCAATVRACVSLASHQAWLTDGAGHVTYGPVPARGGSPVDPTPTGTYKVQYKDRDHWSRQFDAPMPYSVFFYPGVATHADNPRTNSNGCVHLNPAAAKRFYLGLGPGERIQVVP
jgi:lipoprotein-anchoring transpeptidase ErfK/SrfK